MPCSSVPLRERVPIGELLRRGEIGREYVVAGWVDAVRVLGGVVFVILRDRSGRIQLVVKRNVNREAWKLAKKLSVESVVAARGELVESKAATSGRELVVKELDVLSEAAPLPIEREPEKVTLAKRLDWRWIDLRHPRNQLIMLVAAEMAKAARSYFEEHGFVEIFTPKIVGSATEGGANVFPLVYFDKPAFLAQSPQLYKQMGVIAGLERVWEIGPAFRAEPHHTTRHLTEYTSIDFEMGFIDSFEDVAKVAVEVVRRMIEAALRRYGGEIEKWFPGALKEPPKEALWISMEEARKILRERYGREIAEHEDLDSEAERLLGKYALEEHGTPLVVVTRYPWEARPFYTMPCTCMEVCNPTCCDELKPETPTCSFDLLMRGLEVSTGGQRQHMYECLVKQIKAKGLNPESFKWYLEMFRYGAPPHGGAGIGLERVVMQTLGLKNIREARMVPRDPERLIP